MKKKASLLISGITTVAMLAVAVGSFAAWNTLSADSDDFTVSTDTRVELKVSKVEGDSSVAADAAKKLVPKSVLDSADQKGIYDTEKTGSQLAVGAFKLERLDASKDSTVKVGATANITGTDVTASDYKVELFKKDADSWSTTALTSLDNLEAGEYLVKVSYSDAVETGATTMDSAAANKLIDQNVSVKVTCTATR